ncbi:Hypothetical protein SMAX5B_009169 [Scophthalmus maximus]|uniref:Uncharacterized protein n=1 Tax=Scophthalmus maximus TaxID=52904 RepID=A0A2U9C4X4_SCOMX|nr:Hypothetical protein SMAX5B_009169 [Scophthalmus maximus]
MASAQEANVSIRRGHVRRERGAGEQGDVGIRKSPVFCICRRKRRRVSFLRLSSRLNDDYDELIAASA